MSLRVLFVDDEVMVLRGYHRLLRNRFDIEVKPGGAEALAGLELSSFDVIVCDLRMPNMNGREFLTRAREIAPHVRQIVLTGTIDAERVLAGHPVFRLLSKPCSATELAGAIEAAGAAA